MSQLREQLVDTYAQHYSRTNASLDARRMAAKDLRMHDRTFGAVLEEAPRPARILDLGCGVGFLLNWLCRQAGVVAVGVDASPGQVEIARRSFPELEITCQDGLDFLRTNP
jgi:cyclopropane fatty-acyl-phospholipid synthase-like methyltransferase